jgi:hypothetical protein
VTAGVRDQGSGVRDSGGLGAAGLLREVWDAGLRAGWTGVQTLDQKLHFVFGNRSARRNRAESLARLPSKNQPNLSRKADGSLAELIGLLPPFEGNFRIAGHLGGARHRHGKANGDGCGLCRSRIPSYGRAEARA